MRERAGMGPLSILPSKLHSRIRLMLECCLEKGAKDRYGSISEARINIQKVLADSGSVLAQSSTASEPRRNVRTILPWAAATQVFGLIIAALAVWKLKPEPKEFRPVGRFVHVLPEDQAFPGTIRPFIAVSPDRTNIVHVANRQPY
jgi:hypothetical protein